MKPTNAQKVFEYILDKYAFTGDIPTQVQISKDLGMYIGTVHQVFKQLKKKGLLVPSFKTGRYNITRERWVE